MMPGAPASDTPPAPPAPPAFDFAPYPDAPATFPREEWTQANFVTPAFYNPSVHTAEIAWGCKNGTVAVLEGLEGDWSAAPDPLVAITLAIADCVLHLNEYWRDRNGATEILATYAEWEAQRERDIEVVWARALAVLPLVLDLTELTFEHARHVSLSALTNDYHPPVDSYAPIPDERVIPFQRWWFGVHRPVFSDQAKYGFMTLRGSMPVGVPLYFPKPRTDLIFGGLPERCALHYRPPKTLPPVTYTPPNRVVYPDATPVLRERNLPNLPQ